MKLVLTFTNGGFIVTWCSSRERFGDAKQAVLYAAELRKRYPTAKEIESL